jgi:hypothetical protein
MNRSYQNWGRTYSEIKEGSHLDRVSTGSDNSLVSDQHAIFLRILTHGDQVATALCTDPIQEYRSLYRPGPGMSLPVLTGTRNIGPIQKSHLDRVSTGSDSDLVSDQHAIQE